MIYRDWCLIGPRGVGRTTALVEAAKKIGATFVCADGNAAKMATEQGVSVIGIHDDPRGTKGPYIFDHLALVQIAQDYENELSRVEREYNNRLSDRFEQMEQQMAAERAQHRALLDAVASGIACNPPPLLVSSDQLDSFKGR